MVRLISISLLVLSSSPAAMAGEHRPLCKKFDVASLVFEAEFRVRGTYSEKLKAKGYPPRQSAIERTIRTGRVTQVFKGEVQVGHPWEDRWPTLLKAGGPSVGAWSRFMKRRHFKLTVFFEKTTKGYRSAGWAEESAACGGPDSNYRSWCKGYAAYIERVKACQPQTPAFTVPASLAVQVTSYCNSPTTPDQSRQFRLWLPESGAIHWVETRLIQPPSAPTSQIAAPTSLPTDPKGLMPQLTVREQGFLESSAVSPPEKNAETWPPSPVNRPQLKSLKAGPWRVCARDLSLP